MIEVMVVIGIMAIAATIVAPNFIGWRGRTGLRTAANELKGDLLMMKTLAIRDNTPVSIDLNRQLSTYTISANGRDLKTVGLPAGISLNAGGQGSDVVRITFNSRGGANNRTIVLATAGGSREIVVSTLGKITLRN